MKDDPIIRSAEATGYAPWNQYEEPEEDGWETPDGDFIPDGGLIEELKRYVEDDPYAVAEALGFERKTAWG
jgi:hypothetical protein